SRVVRNPSPRGREIVALAGLRFELIGLGCRFASDPARAETAARSRRRGNLDGVSRLLHSSARAKAAHRLARPRAAWHRPELARPPVRHHLDRKEAAHRRAREGAPSRPAKTSTT